MGLFVASPSIALSQLVEQGPVFSLIEENDMFVDTDRHYTQGIKLSFLFADRDTPQWISTISSWVPTIGFNLFTNKVGVEIGQNIYTPGDISIPELLPDDRPYAGWLYTGLVLQRRGSSGKFPTLESFQLDIGIIGEESLAGEAQTWIHEIRDFVEPLGWDNQLHTEPGIALKYQRSYRFSTSSERAFGLDFIPRGSVSLGNVDTSARIGGIFRFGWSIPDDFGFQTIDTHGTVDGGWDVGDKRWKWGCYFYSGVEGRAVLYNAFLDGNLFRDSHSVDKEPLVGEWSSGFVVLLHRVEIGFTYVFRSKEFTAQTEDNSYGSVLIKYKL